MFGLFILKSYRVPVIKSGKVDRRHGGGEMRQDSTPEMAYIIARAGVNKQMVDKCYYGHCKVCHENGWKELIVALRQALR